jgi:putative MATE family efflux protein
LRHHKASHLTDADPSFHQTPQTLATLAADPLASLISTAWVGRIGAVELAGVGIALSVYGAFTKLLNMPLLAIVTGSTASALGASGGNIGAPAVARAVSTALILAILVGMLQSVLVLALGVKGLALWGAAPGTLLHSPAFSYLCVRALGLPAGAVMLALQGAFRGLGDAHTPLLLTLVCNVINLVLEPVLIFHMKLGVGGAAAAVVTAQAVSAAVLLGIMRRRLDLRRAGGSLAASLAETVQYATPTAQLVIRTGAVTAVYACGTALVARTDAVHAAAHQVAFQLWLASSLLADSLAVAAQALLARSLAAGHPAATATGRLIVGRVLHLTMWLGVALALGLTFGTHVLQLPRLFSSDPAVLGVLAGLIPLVIVTQPLNALAFTLDGVAYGVGAFPYAAKAMVAAAVPAIAVMIAGQRLPGLDGKVLAVWAGLVTVMAGRVLTLAVPLAGFRKPFDALHD